MFSYKSLYIKIGYLFLIVVWLTAFMPVQAVYAQEPEPQDPPALEDGTSQTLLDSQTPQAILGNKKLIFIHHSTGENWLTDDIGNLGKTLNSNGYFVSDTNYDWGPVLSYYGDQIGNHTDIGNWYHWFGSGRNNTSVLNTLYAESGQHSSYTRTVVNPGGANEIIMFKSCFPNSDLKGIASALIPAIGSNPLKGQDAGSDAHTISNAKGIYNDLLTYFVSMPDKLFIVITAPPLYASSYGANARAFNNWLLNNWLTGYSGHNVAVFDFYNILTSDAGTNRHNNINANDASRLDGNHHRILNGAVQRLQTIAYNLSAYATSSDDHPSVAGSRKATYEFVPWLNYIYNRWRNSITAAPLVATTLISPVGGRVVSNWYPVYNWNAVSGATNYILKTANSTGVAAFSGSYSATAVGCAAGTGTCTITPATRLGLGPYRWWVETWDGTSGSWSSTGIFTTPAIPGRAVLISPAGAVGIRPIYSWYRVSGATYYRLTVRNPSNTYVVVQFLPNSSTGCVSTSTCRITPAISLSVRGTYTWWIQAWNPSGYGLISLPKNFIR